MVRARGAVLLVTVSLCVFSFSAALISGRVRKVTGGTVCAEVTESTDPSRRGEKIFFLSLDTDEPAVLSAGTGRKVPYTKDHEDDRTLTMTSRDGSGVDTFIIEKGSGRFIRLSGSGAGKIYGCLSSGVCGTDEGPGEGRGE